MADVEAMDAAKAAVVRALQAGAFASHPEDAKTARYVLAALRALPVDERMEAMGMEPSYPKHNGGWVSWKEAPRPCGASGMTDGGWMGRCILPVGHEGRCLDAGID